MVFLLRGVAGDAVGHCSLRPHSRPLLLAGSYSISVLHPRPPLFREAPRPQRRASSTSRVLRACVGVKNFLKGQGLRLGCSNPRNTQGKLTFSVLRVTTSVTRGRAWE